MCDMGFVRGETLSVKTLMRKLSPDAERSLGALFEVYKQR